MAGMPLAYWTIKAAIDCHFIHEVVISTDSTEIKDTLSCINSPKITFFKRSENSASDIASTESAMMEYFKDHVCDDLVLIQATSPLLDATDLDSAFEKYYSSDIDSLLSLVRIKRFYWNELNSEEVGPVNYSYQKRPRRQEFNGQLVENGAFYITEHSEFMKSGCRLNGKIGFHEMDEDSYVEIDEPSDWQIVEGLLIKRKRNDFFENLVNMKVFATDIDGCLTDGGMYYTENDDEIKKFNTRDGFGMKSLQQVGIKVGVITAEDRELNRRRAKKLNLDFDYHGVKSKVEALKDICKKFNVSPREVAYVGDDLNEREMMTIVGFSICPLDAAKEIYPLAKYRSTKKGGDGVIREVSDLYFFLKNTLK